MSDKYVLDDHGQPRLEPDVARWARWFDSSRADKTRIVARTALGPVSVSTVFLGLDHNYDRVGEPVLWETMVFDSPDDEDRRRRYTSREAAELGHREAVAEVKALLAELQP